MDETERDIERSGTQARNEAANSGPGEGARVSRGEFLKLAGAAAAGLALVGAGCGGSPPPTPASSSPAPGHTKTPGASPVSPAASASPAAAYLAIAKGKDAAAVTRAAIEAIGGMGRFMRDGADVIVKPNICVGYHGPEYAATTNPEVVATIVRLCLEAGARRVRVMDNPFGSPASVAYDVSGIATAVKKAGGVMEIMSPVKFVDTAIPRGRAIKRYPVYRDILKADLVVNVPIAKHHSLSHLTLGGKNLLGCVTDRQNLHFDIGQTVADLTSVIKPGLTVVDAVRILTANGPTGGNLADVERKNTVIASADIVAADSSAATLFGLTGSDIPYVVASAAMGLGKLHVSKLKVATLRV
jgi:uncharacterized protein (DUF362 family)